MKIGTRSVLWGVHAFWYHPITVWLAWRRVWGVYPNWWQNICIFCHDIGYIGCVNIDGPEGKRHPIFGAGLAFKIVKFFSGDDSFLAARAYWLTVYHSSSLARMDGREPSALYLPDKVSVLFDPGWFYLFRAKLSGEISEYIALSPFSNGNRWSEMDLDIAWLTWYCASVENKLYIHEKNTCNRS